MTDATLERMQILSFILDEDCFGAEISAIQEVIEYRRVTSVPRTPDFMLGVINLRGQVIPVVDLRSYFGLNLREITVDSCIIIIEVMLEGEPCAVGLLADQVKEVVEFGVDEIKPAPKLGNKINARFIYGVAQHEEDLVILLWLSRIFSSDELQDVIEAGATEPDQGEAQMTEEGAD